VRGVACEGFAFRYSGLTTPVLQGVEELPVSLACAVLRQLLRRLHVCVAALDDIRTYYSHIRCC
jgi:hypothetical protein